MQIKTFIEQCDAAIEKLREEIRSLETAKRAFKLIAGKVPSWAKSPAKRAATPTRTPKSGRTRRAKVTRQRSNEIVRAALVKLGRPARAAEITAAADVPKGTVHRWLKKAVRSRVIERLADRRYRLRVSDATKQSAAQRELEDGMTAKRLLLQLLLELDGGTVHTSDVVSYFKRHGYGASNAYQALNAACAAGTLERTGAGTYRVVAAKEDRPKTAVEGATAHFA